MVRRRVPPLLLSLLPLGLGCEPAAPPPPPSPSPSPPPPASAAPAAPAPPQAEAFVGAWAGDRLRLHLLPDGPGRLAGSLQIGKQGPFPAVATLGSDGVVGAFRARGQEFPFRARALQAGAVLLEADGRDYRLAREEPAASSPPARGDAAAAPAGAEAAPPGGRFLGQVNGLPAVLRLEADDAGIAGDLVDASGYRYLLRGVPEGDGVRAQLTDPDSGRDLPCRLRRDGDDGLLLVLERPEGTRSAGPDAPAARFTRSDAPLPTTDAGRDPDLLGTWGRPSDVTEEGLPTLSFRADGTFLSGRSRPTHRALGVEGQAGSGPLLTGRWRTRGGLLETSAAGADAWTSLGAYEVRGGALRMTPSAGVQEEWTRLR